jgi:hypothetical protein
LQDRTWLSAFDEGRAPQGGRKSSQERTNYSGNSIGSRLSRGNKKPGR